MLKEVHYVVYKELNRTGLWFFTTITARIILIIIENVSAVQYILLLWL